LPFEIHPEVPEKGQRVSDLFPGMPLEGMFMNLSRMGDEYGISFCGADMMSNTHKALLAGEYAKDNGKFHEFHDRIFYEYFTKGMDINNDRLLASIAENIGLDKEEMLSKIKTGIYEERLREAHETARNYNVNSTPTFIIDDMTVLVGAQPIASFKEAFKYTERKLQ